MWHCQICQIPKPIDATHNIEMLIGECFECVSSQPDPVRRVIGAVLYAYAGDQQFDLQDPADRMQLADQLLEAVLAITD